MHQGEADFTLTLRKLCDSAAEPAADTALAGLFTEPSGITSWLADWRKRLEREAGGAVERAVAMRAVNPAFIPRNHRIEQAIVAATEEADFSLFEAIVDVTSKPYEDQPQFAAYTDPPRPEEEVQQTFCGT